MPNSKPGTQKKGFLLDLQTVRTIENLAIEKGLSKSDSINLIVKEWAENRVKEPPEPVLVPVVDRSTIKRVNELQRTVEALTQKVSNLTLRERLGRYSGS